MTIHPKLRINPSDQALKLIDNVVFWAEKSGKAEARKEPLTDRQVGEVNKSTETLGDYIAVLEVRHAMATWLLQEVKNLIVTNHDSQSVQLMKLQMRIADLLNITNEVG